MLRQLLRVAAALTVVMFSACEPVPASSQPEQMGTERYAKLRGWIESKREIAPLSGDARTPASYEYTVRMGDGSSHVFREEMPVSWRVGERLIFIEGSDPLK